MSREFERAVLSLVTQITGGTMLKQATSECEWLARLGPVECGRHWLCVRNIYYELTSRALPEPVPLSRKRRVDAVLQLANSAPRIVEFDEKQHFNCYRAMTFQFYPPAIQLAFDRDAWIEQSRAKTRLEGGGFGEPKPPLFDLVHGRHRQRAFRDAICDILPPDHGFLPTLRIAYFQVARWDMKNKTWFDENDARKKMEALLGRWISD